MKTEYLRLELKKLRKRFYLLQALPILSFVISATIAAIPAVIFGEEIAFVSFFFLYSIMIMVQAFYEGELLVIKCPNCRAYFYRFLKWPFLGWIVFWFFSNCKRCGLSIHGKNVDQINRYTKKK